MNEGISVLEVSVVGCGSWGRNIIRTIEELKSTYSFNFSWVAHQGNSKRASKARDITSAECTTDVDRVLEESEVVAVATPDDTHPKLVEKGLRHDNHVFVEKPISYGPQRAKELYELAENRDRHLMAGHLMVYHPAVQFLKEELMKGKDQLSKLFIHRFNNLKSSGGRRLLQGSFVHDLSILDYFFQSNPDDIRVFDVDVDSESLSYILGSLSWGNRGIVRFESGLNWPARQRTLAIRHGDRFYQFDGIDEELSVYDRPGERHAEERTRTFDRLPLTVELEDFFDAVKNDSGLVVDREHVIRVMETIAQLESRVDKLL